MKFLKILVLIITLSLSPARIALGELPLANLSAEALRELLSASQRQIRSLRVVYRSGGGVPSVSRPQGAYLHRILEVKSPSYLYHRSAHGHQNLNWDEDPLQQVNILTDERLINYYPVNRVYRQYDVSPEEAPPGTLGDDLFLHATGLWVMDMRESPRPHGLPYMLSELALSTSHSRVRRHQEMVGGRWCHVLEASGRDVLWIDVECGASLVARELYDPVSGSLMKRFELDGHRRAKQEIWIPTRIRNIQYDYTAPTPEGRRRIVVDSTTEVLDYGVNDTPDERFEFHATPGTLALTGDDSRDLPKQISPGGLDLLDFHAKFISKQHLEYKTVSAKIAIVLFSFVVAVILGFARTAKDPNRSTVSNR